MESIRGDPQRVNTDFLPENLCLGAMIFGINRNAAMLAGELYLLGVHIDLFDVFWTHGYNA
jgi:hypothetical protein